MREYERLATVAPEKVLTEYGTDAFTNSTSAELADEPIPLESHGNSERRSGVAVESALVVMRHSLMLLLVNNMFGGRFEYWGSTVAHWGTAHGPVT